MEPENTQALEMEPVSAKAPSKAKAPAPEIEPDVTMVSHTQTLWQIPEYTPQSIVEEIMQWPLEESEKKPLATFKERLERGLSPGAAMLTLVQDMNVSLKQLSFGGHSTSYEWSEPQARTAASQRRGSSMPGRWRNGCGRRSLTHTSWNVSRPCTSAA